MELCSINGERVLQTSPAFNNKLISVERETRHPVFELFSSPMMGSNSDYKMSSTRPHWKVRWEMFPLQQVTRGQSRSVTDRILLNSQSDMDWDEMNLEWLTEELLSQRFSLPVRPYMRGMEVILLTNV